MIHRQTIFIFTIFVWLGSLSGLSNISHYDIKQSVHDVNIEIALMLTPYGVIRNLLIDTQSALRPFYFVVHKVHSDLLQEKSLAVSFILFLLISVCGLFIIRKKKT